MQSLSRYKLKAAVGIKVESSPTLAIDACLGRVRRAIADLRLVQGQLGSFVHHQVFQLRADANAYACSAHLLSIQSTLMCDFLM